VIPSVAVIRVQSEHFWCPPIPIPLFLIWLLALLLSPLLLVGLIVLWPFCLRVGFPQGRAIKALWGILCALPGTYVRVTAEGKHVTVRIL
jgi:hypothetical protein